MPSATPPYTYLTKGDSVIHVPKGFRMAGVSCAIKASGKKDVSLIVADEDAVAAGVYTQNKVVAAPVVLCRERTPGSSARAVIVNSGNANACTGDQGDQDADRMCQVTAKTLGISPQQCLVMSTGIIGVPLPMSNVEKGIQLASEQLGDSQQHFLDASDGILTTDKARKIASCEFALGDRVIRIAAMAKGAGMIGPNMATMLCQVLTDAPLDAKDAQAVLARVANRSFNNISVEGHTSTNDTMLLLASGKAGGPKLTGAEIDAFEAEITTLCIDLAKQIPTDGEGASHLIEINVSGAASDVDARAIGETIASSNLVKTAVYGSDPNWGRIVSAAGYANCSLDAQQVNLSINGIELFRQGQPIEFCEKSASRSIAENPTTVIEIVVGSGPGACTHWTSDLTVEYVRFNSEYTT